MSHTLGRGCRCSRADRDIQGGEKAFNDKAPGIYGLAHPEQKNGHFDSQRVSSVHWRTMSQEEPRSEPKEECFLYCHPHGRRGLCLVCRDTRGMRILNNVDNSERTKDLHAQRWKIAALSLCLPIPHTAFLLSRCLYALRTICHL